ncbi:hypothetical protein [Brevibacillus sp. AY1]|uniref:hypothetical protein n=1 Tax=Brevibacillus sp. AY1 TaxID=2807621 RepID=UPI00245430B4|nr:hypothetical protein [Brevibacillus sp. AY1]MDH4617363.1 hypothetical protein [Brevibacillus sp. AY1]
MGKRGRRPWLAGIFALFILLMQVFPMIVLAEGATLQAPSMQVPHYQAPDLKAPDGKTPSLEGVQWEVPDLEPPPGSLPQLETPNYQAPDLQPSGGSMPSLQSPDSQAPGLTPPNGSGPVLQTPGGNGSTGGSSNNGGAPQLQPPSLNPNGNADDKPFGETLGYKMMELSFKDVVGDTLSYTADLLKEGEVSAGGGAGGYAKVLFTLGLKGLDIGLQGTDYENYTGGALDLLGAKGAYDGYKFVVQQSASSLAGGVNAQRSITNTVQGASGAVRVPGIVSGLNAGVAAISLPFDAYNTYTSFGQAFDPKLSEDKQNEKFVDGVGSLGSTLMDAGIIASVIPGGQTVGTVLFVVGGVLWGGSKLVKWANKATGGAVTKWIREKTSGAIGWVKSIFS